MKNWVDTRKKIGCITDEEKESIRLRVNMVTELIKRREKIGLTQQELANLSGIKQPIISEIELGKRMPRMDIFVRLIDSLGLRIKLMEK